MAARQPKGRSHWWLVHQWAGLKLSLFLSFILFTGTCATLSHEIDWVLDPALRATPAEGAPMAGWGRLMTAAARAADAAAPGARVERLSAPYDAWFAVEAIARDPAGGRFCVYLNPATGAVQGLAPWFNAQRLFRELHRHLMLPIKVGLPFVASQSLLLLASLVTAFAVYKKWWRGFFRVPKWRTGRGGRSAAARRGEARRFIGDLHRFAGLWSLWFVAVIGLTGFWYLLEWAGAGAPRPPLPDRPLAVAQPQGAALDALVERAWSAYPALKVTSVYFPAGRPGGVVVMGQADALLVRERANAVVMDAETGQVAQVLKGDAMNLHQRIGEAADPLHFGAWGGFGVRMLWFLFGLVLTSLAVTGVLIYSFRLARAGAAPRGLMADMWRGMGRLAWPAAMLTATGLVLAARALLTFA